MVESRVGGVVSSTVSRLRKSVRRSQAGAEVNDAAGDDYLAPVIDLGQWVPCSGYLMMMYNTHCEALIMRDGTTLIHEHYLACGCRWNGDMTRRTRICKRHPRRKWEIIDH